VATVTREIRAYTQDMGALEQLERFLRELLERPAWILTRHQLQPLELASALGKELESRAVRFADRIVIPTDYEIAIAPEDFGRLDSSSGRLQRELTSYITALAAERNLVLSQAPEVRLCASPQVAPGHLAVRGRFREARPPASARPVAKSPSLRLLGSEGEDLRRFAFAGASLTLGRSTDNDVTLVDTKVSRHHARVDLIDGRYLLRDLDSTNGTRLNGAELEAPTSLCSGDLIGLGLQRLRFVEAELELP
jgi:hypothetical protein